MATAGCAVPIKTESQKFEVCAAARVGGTLVADSTWGLGLINDGPSRGVVWPLGYTARWESTGIVLLDDTGAIVAREGDQIRSSGHASDDGVSHPCGRIQVVE